MRAEGTYDLGRQLLVRERTVDGVVGFLVLTPLRTTSGVALLVVRGFVAADGNPWARCAVAGNPKYDPKVMYWQHLNKTGDGYVEFETKGYCPSPKDGKAPILVIPDPPK